MTTENEFEQQLEQMYEQRLQHFSKPNFRQIENIINSRAIRNIQETTMLILYLSNGSYKELDLLPTMMNNLKEKPDPKIDWDGINDYITIRQKTIDENPDTHPAIVESTNGMIKMMEPYASFYKKTYSTFWKKGGISINNQELKVGDTVKIKHHTKKEKDNYPFYRSQLMDRYEGQTHTIERIRRETRSLKTDQKTTAYEMKGVCFTWHASSLIKIEKKQYQTF